MAYEKIIHLSDLHIRAGDSQLSRFKEYERQFDALLEAIEAYDPENTLIVITGDLFEHKHTLGPSGQILAQKLFYGLSESFTTVVIRGNHDYRQDQPDEPDLIKPFFHIDNPNLHYIDESGLYVFGNIEFGIVVVQDTLIRGAKGGINAELPEFPSPSPKSDTITHRIALFHGTVGGSLLQNGRQVDERNNYPLRTWIKGYDAILLGDIHVQQVHSAKLLTQPSNEFLERVEKPLYLACSYNYANTKEVETPCPWAYAGSLIQQNAGESPWGHGFLVWDLQKQLVTGYHVRNKTGIIVVGLNELQEPRVKIRVGKKDHSLSIETATSLGWFPKSIILKFNPNARNHVQPILNLFQNANINIISTGFQEDTQIEVEQELSPETKTHITNDLSNLNSTETWTSFFQEQTEWPAGEWIQWIKHPNLLTVPTDHFPPDIQQKLNDRNSKFVKTTDLYLNNRDTRPPVRLFRIHYLEFSWLLCFGPKNYLNFDTFIKKVCLLNGNNGSGKSSLLEILGLAIFGESFPSRYSKTYSASIINQHKPKEEHAAYTKLCFSVDGKKYWIHRTFDPQPANPKNIWQRYIRLIDHTSGEILKQNANTVNPWIKEHIGLYEHFLLTTIMTQSSDSDFFSLQAKDQKAIIDSLLQLDVCENFRALLKEARLNHDYALTHLTSYAAGLKGNKQPILAQDQTKPIDLDSYTSRLAEVSATLQALQQKVDTASAHLEEFPDKLFQYPLAYYETELLKHQNVLENNTSDPTAKDALLKSKAEYKDALAVLKSRKYSTKPTNKPKPPQTFQQLQQQLDKLLVRQPQTPTHYDADQHAIWLQQSKPQINVPEQTPKELKKQVKDLTAELQSYEVDEQDFKPVSAKILAGLEKQDIQLAKELEQLDYDIKNTEKELARIQPSPQQLRQLETYKAKLADLETHFKTTDYKLVAERMKKAERLQQEIDHIQSELDSMVVELESIATIKYDPKCDACNKNPYKSKKDSLLEKQKTLTQTLKIKQQTILDTLQTKTPLQTLQQVFQQFLDVHSDKLVTLIQSAERLQELQTLLVTLTQDQKDKLDERDDIQYDTLLTVNTYYALKASLKQAQDTLQAAVYYEEERAWAQAKADHLINTQINELQNDVEIAFTHEYNHTLTRLQELEQTLMEIDAKEKALAQTQQVEQIIEAYPHFTNLKALEKTMKPLALEEASLKVRIENALERQKELDAECNHAQTIAQARAYLEKRTQQVTTMASTFELFTDQLYPLKVGPAIESSVNTVLSSINLPRPIKLKAVWESGNFEWYMEDGDSLPPFEKCSGAQKFFAGLALRIAFSRMGASNMINAQFFMDEGFTACDAETMERVPSLLKNLLKDLDYMQTIFIVSHLENLKTVADESIMITRGAQASLLQVGEYMDPPKAHTVKPEEEMKKKGRPKKVITE